MVDEVAEDGPREWSVAREELDGPDDRGKVGDGWGVTIKARVLR